MRRGLSLAETVVASFLLLIGFLVVARLFHASLRYQEWTDSMALATGAGEEALEGVRSWAGSSANFATLESVYAPLVLDQQGMQVEILAGAAIPMASPCNALEMAYPAAERRMMTNSFKPIQITVRWHRDQVVLHSLIGDAPRTPRATQPVVVSAVGANPLPRDAHLQLQASLYDSSDQEIPDVFFQWSQDPINGLGTLDNVSRDGSSAELIHRMMRSDGTTGYSPSVLGTPARTRVAAGVTYRGQEITELSAAVGLNP